MGAGTRMTRLTLIAGIAGIAIAVAAGPALAKSKSSFRFHRMSGVDAPATPAAYDRVGVLEIGPAKAKNILVLNPGTSSSAAYFAPLARTIVKEAPGWQVWAVERRENLLEDHSVLDAAKRKKATPQAVFDYYLGWLTNSSITNHFQPIPDSAVGFAREWGMAVEVGDLRRVVRAAARRGKRVVLGGHSLGGSITTAYATWDFNGDSGAEDLSGLVFIDGGSSPTPVTPEQAQQSLDDLEGSTPWLSFGGIPAPFAGLFNSLGSTAAIVAPKARNLAYDFPLLPANLKPPVPPDNEAQYGYALDTATSPPSLAAAQAHLGQLAPSGEPRGWLNARELTPLQRYARVFSGWGLPGLDGTAWYHPLRLTIDAGAVAAGNANPAQSVLGLRATHGHDLPKGLRLYAFGASLGGQRVLDAAWILAQQSGIPKRNLSLVNRALTYAHNDPNTAAPKNAFVKRLIPFLERVRGETVRGD
jgi:pimeloyl-ACP methyl ester carboxylesterase